jgi:hypothetical protein
MAMPIPSLTLSSGPAMASGGPTGGATTTGAFNITRRDDWRTQAVRAIPLIVGAIAVMLIFKKR